MMKVALAVLLGTTLLANAAMAAQAFTFRGTLGKSAIIVEVSEPDANGKIVGRYAYEAKGLDIPLHGKQLKEGQYQLREEEPCTDKNCKNAAGDVLELAPLSFEWTLTGDDENLNGTWSDKKTGKSLPIVLQGVGSRTLPESDTVELSVLDPMTFDFSTAPPTNDTMPYDVLKLERPLKEGEVQEISGVKYRMDLDLRINLSYPTIVDFGKANPQPVNGFLKQQRLETSLQTFSCLASAYLGVGWFGQQAVAETKVDVEFASSRLFGFVENQNFDCGGAHPNFSTIHKLVDVKTGERVVAEKLLSGWVAKDFDGNVVDASKAEDPASLTYGPNADLAKYVVDHLDPTIDPGLKNDCGYPDLINTNLGVYVTKDNLVFTLNDLPHVSFACTVDLAKVPLKQAGSLLTDEGKAYFAEMAK